MLKKGNKTLFFITIYIFIIGLIYYIGYKLATKDLINYHKIIKNFEQSGLEHTLKYDGYDDVYITYEGILVKRGSATFYFTTSWEKIKFEDKDSISNQYYIKDLVVNANGKRFRGTHYVHFVSEDKSKTEFNTLNNYFDFDLETLYYKNGGLIAIPALDDAFSESYGLFKREVMSIVELNNYCNEAKFLQKYLARKSKEI